MVISGSQLFSMVLCSSQLLQLALIGYQWFSMVTMQWFSMIISGSERFSMVLTTSQLFAMVLIDYHAVILNGSERFSMVFSCSQLFSTIPSGSQLLSRVVCRPQLLQVALIGYQWFSMVTV